MQISKKAMTFVVAIFAVLATAAAQDTGNATYYADYFHGRKASDGTLYHRDSMTCAHKTYPFGTLLRVRNKKNGNEVYVTVTDRGPFRRGAIVDLSYAAAEEIGILQAGVAPVEVTEVAAPARGKSSGGTLLPELQLLDPVTGKYYTASEWAERGEKDRARAKTEATRAFRTRYLSQAKKEEPRWRVLNDKMTAKAAAPLKADGDAKARGN